MGRFQAPYPTAIIQVQIRLPLLQERLPVRRQRFPPTLIRATRLPMRLSNLGVFVQSPIFCEIVTFHRHFLIIDDVILSHWGVATIPS